jgi:mRNA-degrading endonuclease RelE of RelBE toxin-antitoxin system
MYKPEFHPRVDKELSQLDRGVIRAIRDIYLPRILQSPHASGKELRGDLAGLKSFRFIHNRVDYRIIYDIMEERNTVIFLMVGTRENLYKRLLNRLGK